MNLAKIKVLFLLLSGMLVMPGLSFQTMFGQDAKQFIPVTKIVDGDTFWADDGTPGGIKIRLTGVDAPESRRTGRKEVGYFGSESKQYLNEMLTGRSVRLEYDIDKYDQYNRLLAYVFLEDGTFVNAELVKRGYALAFTVPPNVKYADEFVKLQRKARRHKRGLWEMNLNQSP